MCTNKGELLSEEIGEDWKFSSCTSIERRISLKWILEKFSLRPTDATICSPSFNFLSCQWSLCLLPQSRRGNIVLHLRMENPKSETKVKLKTCLKDRNDEHCVNEFECVFTAEKKTFASTLISRQVLLQEKRKELLYDDVLTVNCEIGDVQNANRGVHRSTTTDKHFGNLKSIQVFVDDMEKLLKDRKSCDVTLQVGDKKFPAHKLLLGARSKVFAAMFEHDTEESRSGTVMITDIEVEVVSNLLQYIYSGQVEDMSEHKAVELYCAGDKYALLDLKERCTDFLIENMSQEHICEIAMMADAHNDGILLDHIKMFISMNKSVLSSEQWKHLAGENLRLAYELGISALLSDDDSEISE